MHINKSFDKKGVCFRFTAFLFLLHTRIQSIHQIGLLDLLEIKGYQADFTYNLTLDQILNK